MEGTQVVPWSKSGATDQFVVLLLSLFLFAIPFHSSFLIWMASTCAALSTFNIASSVMSLASYTRVEDHETNEFKKVVQKSRLKKRTTMRLKSKSAVVTFEDDNDSDDSIRVVEEEGLNLFAEGEDETSSSATSLGSITSFHQNLNTHSQIPSSSQSVPVSRKRFCRTRSVPNVCLETPLSRVIRDIELFRSAVKNEGRNTQLLDQSLSALRKPESLLLPGKVQLWPSDATWGNYILPYPESIPSSDGKSQTLKRHQSRLFSSKSFRIPSESKKLSEFLNDEEEKANDEDFVTHSKTKRQRRNSESESVDWTFNLREDAFGRNRTNSDSAPSPMRFTWLPSLVVGKDLKGWDLDVFALSAETSRRPLTWLLHYIFKRRNWLTTFSIEASTFKSFCRKIELGYDSNIPYHNHLHAADVVASTFHLLFTCGFGDNVPELALMAGIVAAAVHDLKHPGRTARFLIHNRDPLAITYSDRSILEQMHLAEAFTIMSEAESDITSGLSEQDFLRFRHLVIHSVLSTDLKQHLNTIRRIKQKESLLFLGESNQLEDQQELVLEIALKVADVGHAGKKTSLHLAWSKRIQAEFFLQGDEERAMGLSISPHMDRTKPDLAQNQLSFFQFIALPLYETVAGAAHCPQPFQPIFEQLLMNEKRWREESEITPISL